MNAIRPIPMQVTRAVTFKAWRLQADGLMPQVAQPVCDTMDAAAALMADVSDRGSQFAIAMTDPASNRQTVRFIVIKKRAAGGRRWSHAVGGFVEDGSTYAHTLVEFQAVAFDPARPFDAFLDDASGLDRTLVQQ
jgi:hypothetical protein